MILPLIAAYLLFAWIQSYNNDQKFEEYIDTSNQLENIKAVLDNPIFYDPKVEKTEIEQLASEELSIVLYNQDGLVVYSSNPIFTSPHSGLGKENLYKDLYHLNQGYRSYNYKQPVFQGNELVGFFHVVLARDEWVEGVNDRSLLMFGLFIGLFLLIYITIIRLVNRKLNRRLAGLMDEMTAFASGQVDQKTEIINDEIGELQNHFYGMRKQINAARKVIEQEQSQKEYMIATISHDLKTPLTSIKAYAESLENEHGLTDLEQAEYRQVIIDKSNFMRQMLDDLLTYTLLQSSTYEMEFVQVDGGEFFDMLVSDYEALCKQKSIQLTKGSNVRGTYEVNPKQMMRVADNLMSNAIQHTSIGGNIWITATSSSKNIPDWLFGFVKKEATFHYEENMYFIVQNEGKGIAEGNIKQVFDPLYQTDQARSKQDDHGTGLGLSITKQIIEKHGGTVQILSVEDIGTCVICKLPKIKTGSENLG